MPLAQSTSERYRLVATERSELPLDVGVVLHEVVLIVLRVARELEQDRHQLDAAVHADARRLRRRRLRDGHHQRQPDASTVAPHPWTPESELPQEGASRCTATCER